MDFNTKPMTRIRVVFTCDPPNSSYWFSVEGGRTPLIGGGVKFPHLQPPDKSSTDSDDTRRFRYHTDCVNLLDVLLYTRKQRGLQQLSACIRSTNFLLWHANSTLATVSQTGCTDRTQDIWCPVVGTSWLIESGNAKLTDFSSEFANKFQLADWRYQRLAAGSN